MLRARLRGASQMSGPILLVGGDSEIASGAAGFLRGRGWAIIATTRRRELVAEDRPFLDLTQSVDDWQPPPNTRAACLCAAIGRLSDCARDPAGTALVNVTGTVALADRLLARDIPVVFLSTDKVFDGTRPLVPADMPPCPVSEYGRQKAAAEAALGERMRAGAPVAVLRLAKVVSPGMTLLRQWVEVLAAGRPIHPFHDMMMAPTPVAIVAAAIERLLTGPVAGIFQLSGPRDIAYSEIAFRLARQLGADPRLVQPVGARSAGQPEGSTARHTTLDSSHLRDRFGLAAPDGWEVIDALAETCR
jgi:dTDP-4-dehydrorhamnose reductase